MGATTHHDELRQWARGSYPLMAATELLIRSAGGRFAAEGRPWVARADDGGRRIDFERIPENIGAFSGGERRLLLLAASIADVGVVVNIGDLLHGLDRETVELILAAVAYAAGGDSHPIVEQNSDGTASLKMMPPLFPWPAQP